MSATIDGTPAEGATADSGKGLNTGALGLISSVVIGVASAAPAYSLAASLGLVVIVANGDGIIGVKAPAIMLLAFVPMFLIALAYQELNRSEPDCGTTFTWSVRAFGPWVGWMGGWGIIAADVIVMANLAQIAGAYGYQLMDALGWDYAATLADSTLWVTIAGVIWIVLMTWICYRGIEVSARLQYGLLATEVIILVLFAGIALGKVFTGNAPEGSLTPSLSWLWPSGISLSGMVTATLLAVFIYWGWDTAVSVNEESADPGKTPGRAAVLSTLLLVATYVVVTVATVSFAGVGSSGIGLGNEENSGDVFEALGQAVFGDSAFGKLMEVLLIVTVLTSASASTQTTILPTARTSLSMGTFRALPAAFARVHPKYLTPTVATVWMGIVSIGFYVGLTLVSSNVLADSIAALGLAIAFYYGMTGFACVWYYRRELTDSVRSFVFCGVAPFTGGLMLLGAFVISCVQYADPTYGNTRVGDIGGVFLIGIGSLAAGAVLMLLYAYFAPEFFRGQTLPKRHSPAQLAEAARKKGPEQD